MAKIVRPDDRDDGFGVEYWRRRLESRGHGYWWADVPTGPDDEGAVSLDVARRRREAQEDS